MDRLEIGHDVRRLLHLKQKQHLAISRCPRHRRTPAQRPIPCISAWADLDRSLRLRERDSTSFEISQALQALGRAKRRQGAHTRGSVCLASLHRCDAPHVSQSAHVPEVFYLLHTCRMHRPTRPCECGVRDKHRVPLGLLDPGLVSTTGMPSASCDEPMPVLIDARSFLSPAWSRRTAETSFRLSRMLAPLAASVAAWMRADERKVY